MLCENKHEDHDTLDFSNILITMNDDYKINLNGCKNGHSFNNILINVFENK